MSYADLGARGRPGFAGRIRSGYAEQQQTLLARLRRLAVLLDTAVRLPGGIRVGADAVIGLAPGIGDAITAALASYIVYEAHRLGLPKHRILTNGGERCDRGCRTGAR